MNLTYILDFDNTLVSVESFDELARQVLPKQEEHKMVLFSELTSQAVNRTLAFDESLSKRLELIDITRDDVLRFAEELKESLTDSVLECEEWFLENADSIYIVSGGFEDYIAPAVEELGIPKSHIFANRFVYDESGKVTGYDTSSYLCRPQGKAQQVAELELSGPVIMIGDGMSDYEVRAKGVADEFWAFTQHVARPVVVERADRVLSSFEEVEELSELIG